MTRCARTQPRLHELDITVEAHPVAVVLHYYRWTLVIDDREAFGRAWTYKGAIRQVLATAEAIRQLSVIDAELTGVTA